MPTKISTIAVIGAGQMGAGIAQVAAQAGLDVILSDISAERAEAGLASISKGLDRLVKKEKISGADKEAILARVKPSDQLSDASTADFAVEAATERVELKLKIFTQLDEILPASAILASNTSSISITKIAAVTKRPGQVIGMHFMNPVPVMKLVEVIRGLATTDATYNAVIDLAGTLGKQTVTSQDSPGFIVNRILMPLINEAFFALHEGLASAEDIDTAMKLGTNQPMGPLALADFIGLDTTLEILRVLHDELGDPKFRPCPLLRKYVDAGWYGKKTGRGVYSYG